MAHFLLCAVPDQYWQPGSPRRPSDADDLLRQLVVESQALWRRLQKRVNLEMERARYVICLGQLERHLLDRATKVSNRQEFLNALHAHSIPSVTIGPQYFDFLALTWDPSAPDVTAAGVHGPSLGASVFPPGDAVRRHLDEVEGRLATLRHSHPNAVKSFVGAVDKRSLFLRGFVLPANCGLVEIQEVFDNGPLTVPVPRQLEPREFKPPAEVSEPDTDDMRSDMTERLRREVEAALSEGSPVNMSNQPHDISTEVLGEFAGQSPEHPSKDIRIVYADGSEARPFPLRCLSRHSVPLDSVVLKVALMSMRHLDMDRVVDFAWYRNREVSQARALAESDQFCFEFSLRQLRDLHEAYAGRHITLEMYQTGFEPASVGFYRAIAVALSRNGKLGGGWAPVGPWLAVRSRYFHRGDYNVSKHTWS